MILAIDVDYRENNYAVIAGVMFENWQDKDVLSKRLNGLLYLKNE